MTPYSGAMVPRGPQKLTRYIVREHGRRFGKPNYAAFAERVGADRSQIARACKGDRRPGIDLLTKIQLETNGEVLTTDFALLEPA